MWPISVEQLVEAMGAHARPLAPVAEGSFYRAICWIGPKLSRGDIFFVTEWDNHAVAHEALAKNIFCVVSKSWGGLADLDPAQRARCFIADNPLQAYRSLASFMRKRFSFPVVAVGGSNGKTTTKDMITNVLEASKRTVTATPGTNNGWVGTPITLCHPDHRLDLRPLACVIEIGIDEKGAMADHVQIAEPDIAVLTALGPEHLAGLGTHEDAIREELVLFDSARRRVWLADEPALASRIDEQFREGDDLLVSSQDQKRAGGLRYEWRPPSTLTLTWQGESHVVELTMPGLHNARNAALATAVGILLDRPVADSVRALRDFEGPKQRCVITHPTPDLALIDDTYNASPSSIEAAISVLETTEPKRERLVVLGDMLDLGASADDWHASIAPRIAELANTHVRLYGDHMPKIAPGLGDAPLSIGIAKRAEDPSVLLDLPLHNQPRVILVKGSRGMALERLVETILASGTTSSGIGPDPHLRELRVGVLANPSLAEVVRAYRRPNLFVRNLTLEDLEAGEAQRQPYDIALVGDLPFREDVESDLAVMAQLLVTLKQHGVAIFTSDREEDEEAMELLAGVVPPSCRVVRRTKEEKLSELIPR